MLNGKFFATLIGLVITVLAVWYSDFEGSNSILENFINVPRTVKVMKTLQTDKGQVGLSHIDQHLGSAPMFMVPGTMQSPLSPRTSPLNNYGSFIRYNMPSQQHQGVPSNPLSHSDMSHTDEGYCGSSCMSDGSYKPLVNYNKPSEHHKGVAKDPLSFSNMVQENYTNEGYCGGGSCSSQQGCKVGAAPSSAQMRAVSADHVDPNHSDPSYHAANDSIPSSANVVSELPVPDMTMLNSDGSVENPIIYDRFIYANQKSRTRSQGCWFRGDEAIKPVKRGHFDVSVNPHIDLHSGALGVIAGINNDSAKDLYNLQYESSGGSDTTLGGIDISEAINVSSQKLGYQGSATNDVQFTAFP